MKNKINTDDVILINEMNEGLIKRYMKIPPREKLEWLEQIRQLRLKLRNLVARKSLI